MEVITVVPEALEMALALVVIPLDSEVEEILDVEDVVNASDVAIIDVRLLLAEEDSLLVEVDSLAGVDALLVKVEPLAEVGSVLIEVDPLTNEDTVPEDD